MEKMPIRQTSDFILCVSSYMVAGGVYQKILNQAFSFMTSLFTLTVIAVIVFYIKKWLAKEDARINKDGGMITFFKKYIKEKFKNE